MLCQWFLYSLEQLGLQINQGRALLWPSHLSMSDHQDSEGQVCLVPVPSAAETSLEHIHGVQSVGTCAGVLVSASGDLVISEARIWAWSILWNSHIKTVCVNKIVQELKS